MKTKRAIISLREDEIKLLQLVLHNYLDKLPVHTDPGTAQEMQAMMLRNSILKIYKKLEKKNER